MFGSGPQPRVHFIFHFLYQLSSRFFDEPSSQPFSHGLELLLLHFIEERTDLSIYCAADFSQLLHLRQGAERGVVLERLKFWHLVRQDGKNLLLLLFCKREL